MHKNTYARPTKEMRSKGAGDHIKAFIFRTADVDANRDRAQGVISAEHYERSSDRSAEHNGRRARAVTTKAGDIEPFIIDPRRQIDQALYAVSRGYDHGALTHAIVEAIGCQA